MSYLEKLHSIESIHELGSLLGFRAKFISYLIYHYKEEMYYSFQIPKKTGGFREIKAPNKKLKKLQSRLAKVLAESYEEINNLHDNPGSLSHGFRKNHSIVTNANVHKNKRYVFNIDLKDFFPSINFGRVRGYFINNKHFRLNPKIATLIAQIACHENELPQGSSCSPIISNLIGHLLDVKLVKLAKETKCSYSRYADDITFSTNNKRFPTEIAYIDHNNKWNAGKILVNKIEKAGFSINENKSSMQYKSSRQTTTGLIVNQKVNVKRELYKLARSYCHNLYKTDKFFIKTQNNYGTIDVTDGSLNQLEGLLNFIYDIKRPQENGTIGSRKYCPKSITKIYRQLLYYKHFISLNKPLLICEGKTDIIYLKCALKNLLIDYPSLIDVVEEKKIRMKLNFLKFTKTFKDVFAIAEGTSGIKDIIDSYDNEIYSYVGVGRQHPVIIVLDTDKGVDDIKRLLKITDFKKPFIKVSHNLYIVFISAKPNLEIENLFDPKVLKEKVHGKIFDINKPHGDTNSYGKQIFAERVIKKNMATISYEGFKPVLDNIIKALEDYDVHNKIIVE